MKIADKTIRLFLNEIAAKPGTPAGGSIAALCAASAAAMTEMAIRHTLDKVKDPELKAELNKSLTICSYYRNEFLLDMDRDTKYYCNLIDIIKIEETTEEEKNEKQHKLQHYYKEAVNIPLEITYKVQQLTEVIETIIDKGNENYLSDGVAAYLIAKSTMQSLIYHIKFNLVFITDSEFVKEITEELELLKSLKDL